MKHPEAVRQLVQDVSAKLQEKQVHIAVVGDMILDCMIEGEDGGFHPDTHVPILRDAASQESIGGAANIALALSRLGADVSLFGIIGGDIIGRQIVALLDRQPFADYLITERGWPTPCKDWIYKREGTAVHLIQRIDYDRPVSGKAREELVAEFRARCPADVQVVIIADHGLGSIGPESLGLIGLAKERKAKTVAIPRSTVLRGQPLDAIVINAAEMRKLAQAKEDADPRVLAGRYAREYGQHVFLTLFEQGLGVAPAKAPGDATLIEGYPIENPQWMGVRDINTAIVGVGLALGMEPMAIAQVSKVFRHLVAGQRGNGRVLWRDVFRFVGLETATAE